jgi:hypothetical protein
MFQDSLGARAPWIAGVSLLVACLASCSAGSGEGAAGMPTAPVGLLAYPGDGSVTLRWDEVPGATSYTIYWDTEGGVTKHSSTKILGAQSPYLHGSLVNGTEHHYVVSASNAAGESDTSPESSAIPGELQSYGPPWSTVPPAAVIELDYDAHLSSVQNGALLKAAIAGLQAGERLELSSGSWSVDSFFSIQAPGNAAAPIWIAAQSGATPVITRPDASQNTINVGANGPARYLVLQGLEITGGDTAIKIYDASQLWIDNCHIHDCAGAGIAANSMDTSFLYITQNEIHHTDGTAEGMYLGANDGVVVTHDSVVAQNHVHHTAGSQGDGIELKQGSYANRIVENLIHDTQYPCITVYGTGGLAPNLIERNRCFRSGDNVMQVQGEAIVRDNLLVNGSQGFQSHDHQGQSMNLTFVHNTIVNVGRGANLVNWNNRPGMVFANNVVYSLSSEAVSFGSGSNGVESAGNVVLGHVVGAAGGFAPGIGLPDFADMAWDASALDATPTGSGALIGMADSVWLVPYDLNGDALVAPFEPGCIDGP